MVFFACLFLVVTTRQRTKRTLHGGGKGWGSQSTADFAGFVLVVVIGGDLRRLFALSALCNKVLHV